MPAAADGEVKHPAASGVRRGAEAKMLGSTATATDRSPPNPSPHPTFACDVELSAASVVDSGAQVTPAASPPPSISGFPLPPSSASSSGNHCLGSSAASGVNSGQANSTASSPSPCPRLPPPPPPPRTSATLVDFGPNSADAGRISSPPTLPTHTPQLSVSASKPPAPVQTHPGLGDWTADPLAEGDRLAGKETPTGCRTPSNGQKSEAEAVGDDDNSSDRLSSIREEKGMVLARMAALKIRLDKALEEEEQKDLEHSRRVMDMAQQEFDLEERKEEVRMMEDELSLREREIELRNGHRAVTIREQEANRREGLLEMLLPHQNQQQPQQDQDQTQAKKGGDFWTNTSAAALAASLNMLFQILPSIPRSHLEYVIGIFTILWTIGSIGFLLRIFGRSKLEKNVSRFITRITYMCFSVFVIYYLYLLSIPRPTESAPQSSTPTPAPAPALETTTFGVRETSFTVCAGVLLAGQIFSLIRGDNEE